MDAISAVSRAEVARWINSLSLLDQHAQNYTRDEFDERRAKQRELVQRIIDAGDRDAQKIAAIYLRDKHLHNARREISEFFKS